MKRKRETSAPQPPLKKFPSEPPPQTLQSKITKKLQSLFAGFVCELQNISTDEQPAISDVFNIPDTVESALVKNPNNPNDDASVVLQNFINSARTRISGLLNAKQTKQNSDDVNVTNSVPTPQLTKRTPQRKKKTSSLDPLQVQISLKLQSLLCKALDTKKSHRRGTTSAPVLDNSITENDWQDLSVLLQDFMSSAKKKLSDSLNNSPSNGSAEDPLSQNTAEVAEVSADPVPCCSRLQNFQDVRRRAPQSTCSPNRSRRVRKSSTASDGSSDGVVPDLQIVSESDDDCVPLDVEPHQISDFLELEVDSDVDSPEFAIDSDEEVVVLGYKKPIYEEITIDEEEDVDICDDMSNTHEDDVEELLFNCPQCEKSFRVESLLKFHVKMHGPKDPVPPNHSPPGSPVEKNQPDGVVNRVLGKPQRSNGTTTIKGKGNTLKSSKSPSKTLPSRKRGRL